MSGYSSFRRSRGILTMAALIRLGMEWYSKGEPALFIAIDIADYGGKIWTLEGGYDTYILPFMSLPARKLIDMVLGTINPRT